MNDQQAFLNRLIDLAEQADRRGRVTATSFLTPAEQAVAGPFLRNRNIAFSFAGGYADAERARCLFWPASDVPPDLDEHLSVTEVIPAQSGAGHRDYLGSLLGLGLRREQLGDIIVAVDRAFVIHQPNIGPILLTQLTQVGSVPVRCQAVALAAIGLNGQQSVPVVQTVSVSSLRADVVLGAIYHCSRSQSLTFFQRGLVQVDWAVCEKPDLLLQAGQMLSLRGSGRVRLISCDEQTRKGKIRLVVEKNA